MHGRFRRSLGPDFRRTEFRQVPVAGKGRETRSRSRLRARTDVWLSVDVPVLVVGDVFHPVDDFSITLLVDGNVCHGPLWSRTVPVLFVRGEPDHVTRPDLLDGPALSLHEAAPVGHE